jgi:hypothetical protein
MGFLFSCHTSRATPCCAHSRSPKRPSCGRMKMDVLSLRLTSVYSAEAIVASGVLPWQVMRPRLMATLAISPAVAVF